MSLLLSPTQRAHLDKGKALFFSPEAKALRSDPVLGGINQELAALDHFLSGYKHLKPRYNDKGKELPGLELGVDDSIQIDDLERVNQDIAETISFIEKGEVPNSFSSLEPEDIEYLRNAVINNVFGGAIDAIGERGTTNRTYPKNYKDVALRGQKIPAVFEPGQKRERGLKLITDALQNIDTYTGAGTYGNAIDALHGEAAANRPDLLTDIGNIRMGNSSLNQSVKAFEGEELQNSLQTRLLRLYDDRFTLENDVKPAPPDTGSLTKRENLQSTKDDKKLNELLSKIRDGLDVLNVVL